MARQTGIHTFRGKLGSTNGFKMKQLDGWFERTNGGADKNTILTAPEFVRTRENMSEFAGSAVAGKRYRDSLLGIASVIGDVIVAGRFLAICERILHLDVVNPRGQRSIEFNPNNADLLGFQINRFNPVLSIATMPFTFTTPGTRDRSILTVPAFLPSDSLAYPVGATHFAFVTNSQILSNYEYDSNGYIPSVVANNGLAQNSGSVITDLFVTTALITVTNTLTAAADLTQQTLVGSWGVIFYQDVGGTFYRLAQNDCFQIGAAV